MSDNKMILSLEQQEKLLRVLKTRFEKNMERHKGLEWAKLLEHMELKPDKLWSLNEMERTGGEPDVVFYDPETLECVFYDCSAESPSGRRTLCYDDAAINSRKENKPAGSAVQMAADMGIRILSEEEYRGLQQLGKFDMKTSSWISTPPEIRKLGGALFCDRRYNHVFTYHNGAESYYSVRGFRGALNV